jgi:hypothetical protein
MKIFFYCYPPGPVEKAGYENQMIILAEGFQKLGIQSFCNTNVWEKMPNSNDFLLKEEKDISCYQECDIVIFSSTIYNYKRLDLLPKNLWNRNRKYKLVFIDGSDGLVTPGFDKDIYNNVDFILKSHYTKKTPYPKNFVPWQFGFSNRVMESVIPVPFQDRDKSMLINYRVIHTLREHVKNEILPIIGKRFLLKDQIDSKNQLFDSDVEELYWKQTGGRHNNKYYERLSKTMACACFGGELESSLHKIKNKNLNTLLGLINNFVPIARYTIYQYDSFRFWESLVAGCCTFHVDFDQFGFVLPVNPINNKHYIGVNILKPEKICNIMAHEYNYFEDISAAGREWALSNYSPTKVAQRFLEIFN